MHENSPRRSSFATQHSVGEQEPSQKGSIRQDVIEEASEPASPAEDGVRKSPPQASRLSRLLQDPAQVESPPQTPKGSRSQRSSLVPEVVIEESDGVAPDENSPLLPRESNMPRTRLSLTHKKLDSNQESNLESQSEPGKGSLRNLYHVYPSFRRTIARTYRAAADPKSWDMQKAFQATVVRPALVLPAVFLGVLLNLLDALSYGASPDRSHKTQLTLADRYHSISTWRGSFFWDGTRRCVHVLRELHCISARVL